MDMNRTAYFAGYFDGEGSVSIGKNKQSRKGRIRYKLSVSIGSSNNLPLLEIYKYFGGSIKCYKPRKGSKLPAWKFQITGKKALYFLKKIHPYCLIKKQPIEVAFKFIDELRKKRLGGFKPLTDIEINKRQRLKELIEDTNANNFTRPN